MKIVMLSLQTIDHFKESAIESLKAQSDSEVHVTNIAFTSIELIWKVLAPNRVDILKLLTASDPLPLREIARRVNRDVRAVHRDVKLLLGCGVLEKSEKGQIFFPYDSIQVNFSFDDVPHKPDISKSQTH